jgi:hypothetical protein
MKLAIVGTREFEDNEKIFQSVQVAAAGCNITEIVSGGAKGVDRAAVYVAAKLRVPVKEFLPDYAKYGRGAPLKRNTQIVDYADKVIAYPSKTSKGTLDSIKKAKEKGKLLKIIYVESMLN